MLLVVGLGNPGPRYENNRHNIGFMALDRVAAALGAGPFRARFDGLIAEASLGAERLLLLKPMTYMNEAGRAVGAAMRFYKLTPAEVLVLHDEIDLAAGKVRVKTGGGAAGHNGLRSIDQHIGPDYRRVRLGIGHPGDKARVHGHVLGDFAAADRGWLDPLLKAVEEAFPLLVKGEDEAFMTRVAQALRPAPVRRPQPAPPAATRPDAAPSGGSAGALAAALGRALRLLKRAPGPS